MADIKISELSQAESLSLSDLMESAIPYNGGFQSRRMTLAQLSNYLENSVLHNALDTTTKNIIGAINEILHDLANYYTTSQTYSKTEVDTLIAGVSGLHFEVVNALPTQDIDMNTIYLVPKQDSGQQDVYDEFICLDDTTTPATWEKIGTTEIDLSDYVTDTELATILNDYVTTSGLNTILANYATTSAMSTALADKVDKVQGKGLSTEDYTTVEKAKLNGIEPSAQVNVQADWTETDASLDSYIWNKPNVNNVSIAQGTDFGGVLKPIAFTEFYSPTNENTYNHGIFRATDIWKNSNVKGTTSVIGQAHLYAGNWLTNGQEYNAKGYLGVYDESDHTAELTINGTLTASRTYYLPDKDGTLALAEDTVKWSEQNLLGAKNLLPYPYRENTTTKNGITFTINADYSVTVSSGSPSGNTNWYFVQKEAILPSGKYFVSGYNDTAQSNNFCLRIVINQDMSGSRTYNDYGEGVEVTVNDGEVLSIYLHMSSSGSSSGKKHFVMIRPSSIVDATYQEPTLTNRQLTERKTSWEANKATGVKNYINYPYNHPMQGETYTIRAVDYTDNGDGGIVANGTCDNTGNSCCQVLKTTSTSAGLHFCRLPKGRYHFSGGISENYYMNLSRGLIANPSATRTEIGTDYGDGFDFDVTEQQAEDSYFCSFCFVKKNTTATNVIFYPMITRYEDTSDGYAIYAMTNTELTQMKADMENIAPTETSGTASKSYAVGDYMWWRHGFYRVTQAITSGGAIISSGSGTNVTKTTLGAELKSALS